MPPTIFHTHIGESFTELREAESTNNYAMAAAAEGRGRHGMAWFAHNQTKGRGQRGHEWLSAPDRNIALSVLLDSSSLSLSRQFEVICLCALAAYDLFSRYAGDKTYIKWPNDIFYTDRKAGGILTESRIIGRKWQWTVAGIGLNINQNRFPAPLAAKAVSLQQITGNTYNLTELAHELCNCLEKRWQQLFTEGYPPLIREYNTLLYKKEKMVMLQQQDHLLKARIEGVSDKGKLEATTENGPESFNFGEVTLIA